MQTRFFSTKSLRRHAFVLPNCPCRHVCVLPVCLRKHVFVWLQCSWYLREIGIIPPDCSRNYLLVQLQLLRKFPFVGPGCHGNMLFLPECVWNHFFVFQSVHGMMHLFDHDVQATCFCLFNLPWNHVLA